MKKLNERFRRSIRTHVTQIIQNEFDDDTIKLLLIDIRDYSVGLDNLREICHFVAHPERDQGSIHKKILSRFLRIEYMQIVMENAMRSVEIFKPGPKEDFGNYVFRTVPDQHYKTLSRTIYESVIIGGLDDFDDSFFTSMLNLTRDETKKGPFQSEVHRIA
jgi:hypothetical protein